MKCHNCGAATREATENYNYSECGLDYVTLVGIVVRRCPSCGEEETVIPRVEELHRLIARQVARRPGRLEGREIRFLRKYLGHSTEDGAKTLGVDPSTLSRWENEKQEMHLPTERFLRLMVFNEVPVENYPAEELVSLTNRHESRAPRVVLTAGRQGWAATG